MLNKISLEEKEKAVERFRSGEASAKEIGRQLGVNRNTIYRWVHAYESKGIDGLRANPRKRYIDKNPVYNTPLKEAAVAAYLTGEGSQLKICRRYGIRSRHALQNWIKVYNSGRDFKRMSGGSRMSTSRKTTQAERIEIAKSCLENGSNFGETALQYDVSYQQVYTWVKKFKELGEAGLEDRRGQRTAQQEPRTAEEALRVRLAQLEHELYMTKMERDLLKKLDEIERRDAFRK